MDVIAIFIADAVLISNAACLNAETRIIAGFIAIEPLVSLRIPTESIGNGTDEECILCQPFAPKGSVADHYSDIGRHRIPIGVPGFYSSDKFAGLAVVYRHERSASEAIIRSQ